MKTVFRIMPFVILPMTINFPTVSLSHSCLPQVFLTVFVMGSYVFSCHAVMVSIVSFDLCVLQAVFTYWMTSNLFSLGQVALLKHPVVRQKLRIPERITHPASALPPNEGFIKTIKKGESFFCFIFCINIALALFIYSTNIVLSF